MKYPLKLFNTTTKSIVSSISNKPKKNKSEPNLKYIDTEENREIQFKDEKLFIEILQKLILQYSQEEYIQSECFEIFYQLYQIVIDMFCFFVPSRSTKYTVLEVYTQYLLENFREVYTGLYEMLQYIDMSLDMKRITKFINTYLYQKYYDIYELIQKECYDETQYALKLENIKVIPYDLKNIGKDGITNKVVAPSLLKWFQNQN